MNIHGDPVNSGRTSHLGGMEGRLMSSDEKWRDWLKHLRSNQPIVSNCFFSVKMMVIKPTIEPHSWNLKLPMKMAKSANDIWLNYSTASSLAIVTWIVQVRVWKKKTKHFAGTTVWKFRVSRAKCPTIRLPSLQGICRCGFTIVGFWSCLVVMVLETYPSQKCL